MKYWTHLLLLLIIPWFPNVTYAGDFQVPEPKQFTLPNGMLLQVVERHDLPIVAGYLRLRLGSRLDPPGKEGLQTLAVNILNTGPRTLARRSFKERLDELGSSIVFGAANRWQAEGSLQSTTDGFVETYRLFWQTLLSPRLDPSDIAHEVSALQLVIQQQREDPYSVIEEMALSSFYSGQPEAHPPLGTPTSLKNVSRDDLMAFLHDRLSPVGANITLVGDINAKEAYELTKRLTAGWSNHYSSPPIKPVSPLVESRIHFQPTNHDAAHIMLTFPAPPLSDATFAATDIIERWFGLNSWSSFLGEQLRNQQGMVYSLTSYFENDGYFLVRWSCSPDNAVATTQSVLKALTNARDYLPQAEELARVKKEARQAGIERFEGNLDTAIRLSRQSFYGNHSFYRDVWRLSNEMSVATFHDLTNRLFQSKVMIAVIGPPELADRFALLGIPISVNQPKEGEAK